MEREEILKKASKKAVIGEMERQKINKANWVAVIVAGIVAVAFMIIEGIFKHFSTIYVLSSICYLWASVMYLGQFLIAKRPWQVLIGAVIYGILFVIMITIYVLSIVQAW